MYNYAQLPTPTRDMADTLRRAGDIPNDYEEKKVMLAVEAPEICNGDDFQWARILCPEVPLFDRTHTPGRVPSEAVTSFSWLEECGMEYVEHKHFSECLEFIRGSRKKPRSARTALPSKLRFAILTRDNFKCGYCGRSPREDGVALNVDHKTSVVDGGTDDPENLITACSTCNLGKGADSLR
jgi:5-methylcytosine-specific restriction endonuclease McrA